MLSPTFESMSAQNLLARDVLSPSCFYHDSCDALASKSQGGELPLVDMADAHGINIRRLDCGSRLTPSTGGGRPATRCHGTADACNQDGPVGGNPGRRRPRRRQGNAQNR